MSELTQSIDPEIRRVLSTVFDPCCKEKGISVVDMGLLHRATVTDRSAQVELLLTSGWCPFAAGILTEIERVVSDLPHVDDAKVEIVWNETWTTERLSPEAAQKLHFLPPPADVADTRDFVAANWVNRPTNKEI